MANISMINNYKAIAADQLRDEFPDIDTAIDDNDRLSEEPEERGRGLTGRGVAEIDAQIGRRHGGTGAGRRPSIRRRISTNCLRSSLDAVDGSHHRHRNLPDFDRPREAARVCL